MRVFKCKGQTQKWLGWPKRKRVADLVLIWPPRALEQVGEDSPQRCGGRQQCGCLLELTPVLPSCPVLSSNEELRFIIGSFITMLSLTCSSRSGANSCDGSVGMRRGFPVCFTGRDDGVRLLLDTSL